MRNIENIYNVMFHDYPDIVNLKQMMEMLGGISSTLAYKILKSNTVGSIKVGREYKIPKVNIISYIIANN
ncbi:MAG: DNA-binding protein [Clostridia bacterium]|nr:DNA-binding protein [Clostridia bacterium]